MSLLAPTLEAFFTERLLTQRQASAHTVSAYRDTFRLLLRFAAAASGKPPSQLEIDDLDARVIGRFLDDLERNRHNRLRVVTALARSVSRWVRNAVISAVFRSPMSSSQGVTPVARVANSSSSRQVSR
jgi:integrase/recombinase XerD